MAGFGVITFIFMGLALIIAPSFFPELFQSGNWNLKREIVLNFTLWSLISVAFIFYAHYVGQTKITFHSAFILILLSLAPVVILIIATQFKILKTKLQYAVNFPVKSGSIEEIENEQKEIEFLSLNKSEKITVQFYDLIMLRSADNYVEIFWINDGETTKKLIRQTLKNIESLLKNYPQIIRCHRTCLVNTNYISKLNIYPQGYKLKMKNIEEEIPVSRQYILKVKEVIKGK